VPTSAIAVSAYRNQSSVKQFYLNTSLNASRKKKTASIMQITSHYRLTKQPNKQKNLDRCLTSSEAVSLTITLPCNWPHQIVKSHPDQPPPISAYTKAKSHINQSKEYETPNRSVLQ